MRKFVLSVTGLIIFFVTYSQNPIALRPNRCGSHEAIKQQMVADPVYAKKVEELLKNKGNYSRKSEKGKPADPGKPSAPSSITIPVVVHVLYYTADQNISDAQVQSQIDVLNEDFTATNSDYNNYDAGYGGVKGDLDINFCLVQIIHKQTKHRSFGTNDNMKFDQRGGSDAVDPMHNLNIWVCNLGQSLLGYAYYPGITPERFGVVCHTNAFGRGAGYNLFADFNLGRTTTHETGHCFGLVHIWGDANCGNDKVDDTPLHNTANYDCPEQGHLSTCTGTPLEMWMNYMDYTDDRCMYFFSDGQASRADFFIDTDPQLNSIINSACTNATQSNYITSTTNGSHNSSRLSLGDYVILYPTITSGQLTLSFNKPIEGQCGINIYNQTGALVMKKEIAAKTTAQIDVSRLGNGIYFLEIIDGVNKQIKRFIVQH